MAEGCLPPASQQPGEEAAVLEGGLGGESQPPSLQPSPAHEDYVCLFMRLGTCPTGCREPSTVCEHGKTCTQICALDDSWRREGGGGEASWRSCISPGER